MGLWQKAERRNGIISMELIKVVTEGNVEIITDDTLHEIREHGTQAFPFQCYHESFHWDYLESVEWHWHSEMEFIFKINGSMKCMIGEQQLHLDENCGILINSGVIHRFQSSEKYKHHHCELVNILFLPELIAPNRSVIYQKYIQPILDSGTDYFVFYRDIPWQNDILKQLETVDWECQTNNSIPELRIQIGINRMWLTFAEHMNEYPGQPKTNKNMLNQARLRQMMQYIWDNYTERITLENIAQAANISKSAALRCFRNGIQTSPVGYLNDYRLSRAKELLLKTQRSVSEIAVSVGFDNAGYFDRVFKRAFGITPKQFVKQVSK